MPFISANMNSGELPSPSIFTASNIAILRNRTREGTFSRKNSMLSRASSISSGSVKDSETLTFPEKEYSKNLDDIYIKSLCLIAAESNNLNNSIDNIISNKINQVNAYKSGKTNLFDYFVGQVMKETKGKANPTITKEILKDKLDN